MKRFGQLLTVALFASAVWTTSANAAAVWYDCKVIRAGMGNSSSVVMLVSDLAGAPAFTNKWVVGITPIANQMLAVALTAMSLEHKMRCHIDLVPVPALFFGARLTNVPLP